MANVTVETSRDDVKLFEHPLLDELATEISREYVKMLGRMNAGIASILKHAHGVSKSEGLYVIHGGLGRPETIDLLKAAKPAARKKMSDAEAAQKRKEAAVSGKGAGSRGGKWWRDSNGHVRYGKKPTDDANEREWKPLDEEEVKKLHENLQAVYGYHHSIRDEVNKVLGAKTGLNGELLMQVFRDANSYGMDIGEYWEKLAVDAGSSEEDAREALEQVFEGYRSALSDPDFRKKARQAIQKRQLEEQHAGEQVRRSGKYTEGKSDGLFSGNAKDEAIRVLGLLSDMELLHIPHNTREAQESFDNTSTAKKNVGSIVPNKARLQALYSRLDDMDTSQLVATYVAQMFRDMREGGYGFDGDKAADEYFKDSNGKFESDWLPEGDTNEADDLKRLAHASEVERANILLNTNLMGARDHDVTGDETPASRKDAARIRELAHEVHGLIQAFNSDQGGQELGLIFTNQISPESLFKNDNALKELAQKVAEHQKLVSDALAAQASADFDQPTSMDAGFEAMTKELQAKGILPKGVKAGLLDYQKQALNWMKTIKRGILAYDTGMGKTPMSIAMVAHMHEEVKAGRMKKEDARGIMVMPLGLTKQWPGEIKKFFPDAKVVTIGDDIEGVDDRIAVMEAIQSGKLEADFVILSSSVVNFHADTRESFKNSELFEEGADGEMKKKKGVSEDEVIASMRDAAAGDKLCTALRGLKGTVFFDEAHHEQQGLKSAMNVRNAAAREFLKDRERSFLLTATPMPNGKPNDLFELMDLIHPGSAGPDSKKFENKMSVTKTEPNEDGEMETRVVGLEDWSKVARDVSPYVFRKSKLDDDVVAANEKAGMKLPSLQGDEGEPGGATHGLVAPESFKPMWANAGNFKPHDFDERQAALPEKKRKKFKTLEEMDGFGKQLRVMHQQQMLSVTPKLLFGEDKSKWPAGYNGEQPKLTHMANLVKKHFQTKENHDKPIVIFSQWPGSFKYAREELEKAGIDPSLVEEYHGGVDPEKRNAVVEATNAGKIKVLFVGTQAGGAGLNLQKKANKMIFLDQPWMTAHKTQALGRVWRTGQESDVEVINLYMKGTFDAKKLAGLETKSATDIAASSAHLDEAVLNQRSQNMFLQVLGGKDASKIEGTSNADLQARIDAKGLTGLVTPAVLKQKFDLKPFSETVAYKDHLDFGQQSLQTQRMVLDLKLKNGDFTKEEHAMRKAKLDRAELAWVRQNKLLGRDKVAISPDAEPTQPEPTFVPSPTAKGVKTSDMSETARAVYTAMKKHGSLAITDFIDEHLKEHLEKEVERDPKSGKPLDPMAHYSSVKKWHDNRDDIEKEVKQGFKELEKLGAISMRSGKTPKASETKLPEPTKATKKPVPAPEPTVGQATVNYSGGWGWKFEGAHTSTKEYKKAEVDFGGGAFISLKDLVPGIKGDRKKPKSLQDMQEYLSEISGRKVTEAATRKCIKLMHEHGVMT